MDDAHQVTILMSDRGTPPRQFGTRRGMAASTLNRLALEPRRGHRERTTNETRPAGRRLSGLIARSQLWE
jgi:hypothetical protein